MCRVGFLSMSKTISLSLILLLSHIGSAIACLCKFELLDFRKVESATDIVVFQMIRGERHAAMSSLQFSPNVTADVEVEQVLAGRSNIRKIMFSSFPTCCGTRVEIGRTYVAFLNEVDLVDDITALVHNGNLVEVNLYLDEYSIKKVVERVRAREVDFDSAFPRDLRERTWMYPPPLPPPPPLNCSEDEEEPD